MTSRFVEGEKVLCFHGPLLYEARCHKVDTEGEVDLYLIHYNGWNNKWDEWIPETRILKYNEMNLKKQSELIRHHKKSQSRGKAKKGKNSDCYENEDAFSAKVKSPLTRVETEINLTTDWSATDEKCPHLASLSKRYLSAPMSSSSTEREVKVAKRMTTGRWNLKPDNVSIQVELPEQLKHCLLDDWDLITQQKYLLQLPTANPVSTILEEYRVYNDHEIEEDGAETEDILEADREAVLEGITGYFTRLLGMQLLYKFERPQYAVILEQHKDKSVAEIYGAEHLLRLFVKIGELLAFTELDNTAICLLQSHIHSLLDFIELHRDRYLHTDNYAIAPPDYLRRAGV